MNKPPSLLLHLRDILILPVTVTVIIPIIICRAHVQLLPDHPILRVIGALVGLAGFSLFAYTVYLFRTIGKGTLAPWEPTQHLVISGPYRYCRNPMITGVLGILLGEVLFLNSFTILIWVFLFFLINTTYFIFREEPGLEKRFGDEYIRYKEKVPRWIPNLRPYLSNP